MADWRDLAACADFDPEWWFPLAGSGLTQEVKMAREICRGCPVAGDCLEYALDTRPTAGVWGGMTMGQLSRLSGERRPR